MRKVFIKCVSSDETQGINGNGYVKESFCGRNPTVVIVAKLENATIYPALEDARLNIIRFMREGFSSPIHKLEVVEVEIQEKKDNKMFMVIDGKKYELVEVK